MSSQSLHDWWKRYLQRRRHQRRRRPGSPTRPAEPLEHRQFLSGLITTLTPTASTSTSGTSTLLSDGLSTITGVDGTSGGTTTSGTSASSGTSSSGTSSSGTSEKQAPSWLAPLLDWQTTLKNSADRYQQNAASNRTALGDRLSEILATYAKGEDLRARQSEDLLSLAKTRIETSSEELAADMQDLDDQAVGALTSLLLIRDQTRSALQRHTDETFRSDADYQAAVLKIRETHSLLLQKADDDFQSALDHATADRQAALNTALDRYDQATATAATKFNAAIDRSDADFDTAFGAALDQLSTAVDAEWTVFDTAVATAQSARDAVTVPLSSAFDLQAPETDSNYLAAVTAALARLENRVSDIVAQFEQAMTDHRETHEAALTAADATFEESLAAADDAYAEEMQSAYDTHQQRVTEAVRTFDDSVQGVQARFDAASTRAFDTYDQARTTADDDYTAAVARADANYETKIAGLQKAYDKYKSEAPAEFTAKVKAAADTWVDSIMSARDSVRSLIPTTAKDHWQTVVDSLDTLAQVSDAKVQAAMQAFVGTLNTAAKTASSQYADDMNRSIGTFATYDEFLAASNRRLRDAVLGYLDSVVRAADQNFPALKQQSLDALDGVFTTLAGEIGDVADADTRLLMARTKVQAALDEAEQAGQAVFHQKLADLQSAALQRFQTETATYETGRHAAVAARETAKATAVEDRTVARTTAGKTLVDSITTAAETAVEEYNDDWKTLREALVSARDQLVQSAADAETNWNQALDDADQAWTAAARDAGRQYTADAIQSRTEASSQLRQATAGYTAEIYDLWTSAMQAIYPSSQDREAFLEAWQTYGTTVTAAWTTASDRLTDSVNQFADSMEVAEESRLRATAVAAHEHNLSITQAEIDRLVAQADAQRKFDTTFTAQTIARARARVAADANHDREQAATAKTDIDAQAKSARELIERAVKDEQAAEDTRATSRRDLANEFYRRAFAEARALLEDSEQLIRQSIQHVLEETQQAGDMRRDNLLAGLKFLQGQRRNDLEKGLAEGLAAVQKRLNELHDGPLADLTVHQSDAGHGTVPNWVLSLLNNLQVLQTQFTQVADQARLLKGQQVSAFPSKPTLVDAVAAAGPDAYTVLNRVLGLAGRIAYRDQVGEDFVGWYDVALGMVIRSTRRTADGPIREIAKPYAEVRETDLNSPKWNEVDWNVFFGGLSTNDPGDPETETLSYRAIEFLVGQEKLAQNDGLLGDILLTTQLVTEAVGLVDPTGASDAVNAVVCLAQGDNAGAAMAVASIAVPIGADKLIKHAQKVPTGLVARAKNHVTDLAQSAAQTFRKTADRADDVVAQAKHAKKVGEETATSMAARSCGNPGNCFVAGTLVLVARGPAEVRLLADVGASVSPGDSSADGCWVTPLLAAGALGLWLTDRPARRRQRRFVRGRKSIGRRPHAREAFLEPEDDHVSPRSPQRRSHRLRRGISSTRRTKAAVATVAARPSAAVLCEPGLPVTSRVSRAWELFWNLAESSRVSASVAVKTWPRRSAARAAGQRTARTGVRGGLRRGLALVLAVAALASWFWQPGNSTVAPSGEAVRTVSGRGAADSAAIQPAGSERVTGPSGQAYHARAIETIRTGQRVLARNPQVAEADLADAPVDPASWVNIHLRMAQATGDPLEITLLRPVEWLAVQLAETAVLDAEYPQALEETRGAGGDRALIEIRSVILSEAAPPPALGNIPALGADQAPTTLWIFLALHELAAVGPAEVLRVEPCPPIEPGAGRLVTGTFSHHSGEVLAITVDGLTEPIGCTGAHPFWSEDRQDFIPARDLVPGETLRTESGTLRQITRITPRRGPPVPVFNLEVDAEHVYYVSVDGVLVHNAYESQGPTGGRYRGGSHADMSATERRGDGLDSHHMPDRYADPNTPCGDGPAIQMDPADHHATSSNGRHGLAAARFRAKTAELIAEGKYRDAMAREIWDVRRAALEVSGDRTKYNEAIREMLEFARKSGQLPGK